MGKKKNYYYVLVLTSSGPVFVTGIEPGKYARYDKLKAPKEFDMKEYALDVANGLTLNFNLAYMVHSNYPIENQPYLYDRGEFAWKWDNNEEDSDE